MIIMHTAKSNAESRCRFSQLAGHAVAEKDGTYERTDPVHGRYRITFRNGLIDGRQAVLFTDGHTESWNCGYPCDTVSGDAAITENGGLYEEHWHNGRFMASSQFVFSREDMNGKA